MLTLSLTLPLPSLLLAAEPEPNKTRWLDLSSIRDWRLTESAKAAIKRDEVLKKMHIALTVDQGVAKLSGWVESDAVVLRVKNVVLNVPGIVDFVNHSRVVPKKDPLPQAVADLVRAEAATRAAMTPFDAELPLVADPTTAKQTHLVGKTVPTPLNSAVVANPAPTGPSVPSGLLAPRLEVPPPPSAVQLHPPIPIDPQQTAEPLGEADIIATIRLIRSRNPDWLGIAIEWEAGTVRVCPTPLQYPQAVRLMDQIAEAGIPGVQRVLLHVEKPK